MAVPVVTLFLQFDCYDEKDTTFLAQQQFAACNTIW